MHMTIIHPAIGHTKNERYIRSWQMESLPAAAIAGLTPDDVDISFYDDRMEKIPFDNPTDVVTISVETYTAKRAYQIASEYRRRGIPVIMGGLHATLLPDEVEEYAEAVVVGEAESIWEEVINDLKNGTLKQRYQGKDRPSLKDIRLDRSIFQGKRYLPIGLVETGRGCRYACEFCAIQAFFDNTHRNRPIEDIVKEIESLKNEKKIFFFVDDNFIGDIKQAKELLRALIPLNIRWITQMSIDGAQDEELLQLLDESGCKGVLIGFESLDEENLKLMNKSFNTKHGGYEKALENLQRYNIRIYATFVFGYDYDTQSSFDEAVEFAKEKQFYIAAFNHLTPFPGTPLYRQLEEKGRLRFKQWWLDDAYRYNDLPFEPEQLAPQEVTRLCVESRRKFYSLGSIFKRLLSSANRSDGFMLRNYLPINWMHRRDVSSRNGYPLGDENWQGRLLKVKR
jgi:radical SAM superfamily enzyme YgiQ (UPF0313 family)